MNRHVFSTVVLAVFVLLALGSGSDGPSDDNGPVNPSPPSPPPAPSSPPPAPSSPPDDNRQPGQGSPRDLFEQQVGDFRLQNVGDFPAGDQLGAVEAASARYSGPNGISLEHNLMEMPSARDAEQVWQRIQGDNEGQGLRVTTEQPVELDGREVGTVAVLEGTVQGQDATLVMWHNQSLYGEVIAQGEGGNQAVEFYRNVPY